MSFSGSNMHEDNLHAGTSELASDSCLDLSQEIFRIGTFASFPNGCPISMSTLARAGFYYTGEKHKVKCFSCGAVVEEWTFGESPIAKHRRISPHCKFINGGYNVDNVQQFDDVPCQIFPNLYRTRALDNNRLTLHPLGVPSVQQDIDPNYLLRTKQIVDMSDRPLYPRTPSMCSEEVRIMSFQNWPSYSPITPRELANAGLFYKGVEDQVECFCCGGKLKNWEPGDCAWTEHKRHFPNCFFVLKHDVGNIPYDPNCGRLGTSPQSEGNLHNGTEGPKYAGMANIEERVRTFMHWNYPIDAEKLARAGFYSTGIEDNAVCFYCGGALRNWESNDDPWEQHAKWYPGCSYLIQEKSRDFVNSIHLRSHNVCYGEDPPQKQVEHARPLGEDATQSSAGQQEGATVQSAVIQHVRDMGFELEKIVAVVEQKLQKTGKNYDTVQALVTDLLKAEGKSDDENMEHSEEADVQEKLRRLQEEKLCKICMDKNICIVFIPCGHLVTCQSCAAAIEKCPICCCVINQRLKTFMS